MFMEENTTQEQEGTQSKGKRALSDKTVNSLAHLDQLIGKETCLFVHASPNTFLDARHEFCAKSQSKVLIKTAMISRPTIDFEEC